MSTNGTLKEFSESQQILDLLDEVSPANKATTSNKPVAGSGTESTIQSQPLSGFLANVNWANEPITEPVSSQYEANTNPETSEELLGAIPLNQFLAKVNWANAELADEGNAQASADSEMYSIESVFGDIQWD